MGEMNNDDLYYLGPVTQLLPVRQQAIRGPLSDDSLEVIDEAGILWRSGKIVAIDKHEKLAPIAEKEKATFVPTPEHGVVLPGFIDAHTHLCFAGSRARDYALRNAGATYLEIAKAGGGIWDTVTQTRQANDTDLLQGILERASTLLQAGVTTIEAKSGYGLSVEHELRMLRLLDQASKQSKATIIPTCLAAHMVPKDFSGSSVEYLSLLLEELLPILQQEDLCKRIDIFTEQSAFNTEESLNYLLSAKKQDFQLTVHADQFTPGGSLVAIEAGALSADHLEASGEKEIAALAKSKTVAMALPGASLGLGCAFTPARKLLDAGACVAIASDWNPGSAPMGDLLVQACLLGTFEKLSNAEVLTGITQRAAQALDVMDRGSLSTGQWADFLVFPTNDYREIFYQQGRLRPAMVFKGGEKIQLSGQN